ncbi:putative efflux pump membrane fusion protein [Planctomycetes bacterium CA13]|uniref:Putative efflux pump membrane fusion protein n=1 Tax=Novipirellula herctigrandis TaxID=2527986 RepID=A0A5C5Z1B9_9BACT|nr:putative efflux pump membrane fusion protein [Planctomycetes bacterium CA13]
MKRLATCRAASLLTVLATITTYAQEAKPATKTIVVPDAQVSYIQNTFLAAPISGIVESIHVSEGENVDKDALLIQLDSLHVQTEYEAAVAAMEAAKMASDNDVDARYARRALDFHLRELSQSQQANTRFSGAVSDSEVEKLRLVVDQARLAIEQAEHEQQVAKAHTREKEAAVQFAKQRVDDHAIRASVSGQVVEIVTQNGEWVEAGKPVVRVISVDPIRIECFVDGRQHGPEQVGRKVNFVCEKMPPIGGIKKRRSEFQGIVDFVSPELHPVTGQVRLWATVRNSDGLLRSGMRGRIEIQ